MAALRPVLGMLILLVAATLAAAGPQFDGALIVSVGGEDLTVPGHSVPEYADWNADGTRDLIVGEGGDGYEGKVRVYLNQGSNALPVFDGFFYAQTEAGDLAYPGG